MTRHFPSTPLVFTLACALAAGCTFADAAAADNKKKKNDKKQANKTLSFKKDWRNVAHPLIVAAYDGDAAKLMAELRKKDTDVNVKLEGKFRDAARMKGIVGGTALLFASWQGQDRVIPLLLRAKADVNARDVYQRTALHWAAMNGRYKVVQLLVKAEADLNAKDKDGHTPLFYTIDERTKAILEKAGAKEE